MAAVSSTSNSYSSLSSQIRGYGGLASGLDRDTLIEQMTSGTRSKIAKQGQQKTKIEWQMEAMRDITSKIYNFTSGYTSYASPNNLLSSNLFSRNQVTAVGDNSKYVSVSGTAGSDASMSIAGIKQLASNARLTTGTVSNRALQTGAMALGGTNNDDLSVKTDVSTIAGDAFYIKYGNTNYTVKLLDTDDYDYSTEVDPATGNMKVIDSIQKSLDNVTVGSGTNAQKLGDIVKVSMDGGKIKFTADESKAHGNAIVFRGGTGNILEDLGILRPGQEFSDLDDEEKTITADGLTGQMDAKFKEEKSLAQRLSGSQIGFNYNGEFKTITLGKYEDGDTIDKVKTDLQNKLDEAFGKGRIEVKATPGTDNDGNPTGSLSFTTVKKGGAEDASSTLAISSGSGIVGNTGAFGIVAGTSNRVNLSANLKDSGLKTANEFAVDADGKNKFMDANGNYNLTINGKKVEGITKDTTVKEIINKINATEGIGVTVSYQEMSDRFVITSTENGTSGDITFDKAKDGDPDNIAKYLFGNLGGSDSVSDTPSFTYEAGQDAVLSVKYPGSDDAIEITRGSNTFSLDGLNITLKGTFGYKQAFEADGTTPVKDADRLDVYNLDNSAEAITFEANVDADKAVDAVKGMIESFNEILELVNTQVKTKPDRDYSPLTDEQKEEMSESQIEKWEAKAKEGILFADMDLRMMADNLRTVINSANTTELSNIGITVSTNYSDNGKLVFDETKFRTALQNDPDAVKNAFTRAASTGENGNAVQGGLMVRMKSIMDKYGSMTGATKGILVERAGSIYAPTSVLSNSLQKQLDSIDDYIKRLQDKLETETDRYISQFTSLETLISQMNNQSSYLSSMFA